jgi:hypothetical protein
MKCCTQVGNISLCLMREKLTPDVSLCPAERGVRSEAGHDDHQERNRLGAGEINKFLYMGM